MKNELLDIYGPILEDSLLKEIDQVGVVKNIAEGSKLMEIGEYINSMPLLLSGVIKVLREDNNGDELLLYFLEIGDTCAMTLNCCMEQSQSEVRALAETDVEVIMVPVQKMEEWMAKYTSWRHFVLNSYQGRLNEMFETIDSIAFLNMDQRLYKHLKDKARITGNDRIQSTHQQIAYDLHTSRVVVSRLLKTLENRGKIKLNRNFIDIIDL
ncbi:Crp/Fnr family transcriptional regulator [Flavobacteriaceae bacterium F89]|uniref:Crp/Fnr family transcriptional regulator n=1 Tax=Cerina litoralis TaxID=2874477 RepID=A0AAE3ETW8_9FLAO|nr:Crp/Fnr family transcriptional regulator [Cerina litoralis]MCG2460029.1 Crp/Fnr family transcriptional regulator [Cerina litoralis]